MTTILNPFLYGKPVPPMRFVGRRDAIRTIFSRLSNGDSTAVVGEPHIGKSSLLVYVADEAVRSGWLHERANQYVFMEVDCHMIPHHYTPSDFWRYALTSLPTIVTNETFKQQWQAVKDSQFDSVSLVAMFRLLSRIKWRLVLLIDEFDTLLNHPNFEVDFFAPLRSMATRTDSLSIITASRLSITTMNQRSQEVNPLGSPFFNNITEVQLRPLSIDESRTLINTTLDETGIKFNEEDYAFIDMLSGGHPFLVQTAAACLFDSITELQSSKERYQRASELFQDRAEAHFNDYWRNLSNAEQATLMTLALGEVIGHLQQKDYDNSNLSDAPWLESELRHLAQEGIIEQIDKNDKTEKAIIWQDKRWRIRRRGLVLWLTNNIVAETNHTVVLESWLNEKIRQGLITSDHATHIRIMANTIPQGFASKTEQMTELLITPKQEWISSFHQQSTPYVPSSSTQIVKTVILFLASEPIDMVRLRIGKEFSEIQENLRLAKLRENFELYDRFSVRTTDVSQSLLDVDPKIVHFSGHGASSGELCFESSTGNCLPVSPEALSSLFRKFSNKIICVILNACFSEIQARAIAKHIDYVIGMNQEIEDTASIAFSIGFYQALGAGRTIEDAYDLGCVQINLQGAPKHLMPVLIKKSEGQQS